MRKLTTHILLLVFANWALVIQALSQSQPPVFKPINQPTPAATTANVQAKPAAYATGVKINYVRSREAVAPISDYNTFQSAAHTMVKQTTQYFDGLGRALQTVTKAATPQAKDLVAPVVYDDMGRESFQYLPYVANSNTGNFRLNPFTEQETYLKSVFNPTNNANGEKFFYSKTIFETSPLNRPLKTFAPGNSWVGSEGAGINEHAISMAYEINTVDEVRLWTIDAAIGSIPESNNYYDAGQLYRTVTTDEHGKKIIEYKNKEGHVLLKKVQIEDVVTSNSHSGWLCTYYVYDDFGLLRFVMQPQLVKTLAENNFPPLTTTQVNELCFRYDYDERNRMIIKKVPGADEVYMVYDKRDRLVLTQDANLRNQYKWLVTKYDILNRPIQTLLWENGNDRAALQDEANRVDGFEYPQNIDAEILTETYYDNYSWMPSGINGIDATLHNGYNNSSNIITTYNTSPYYAQPIVQHNNLLGLTTGTKVRVLGTSDYLYTVQLYDDKGRVIQVRSSNNTGGYDIVTNQYDFSGKVLRSHLLHQNAQANTSKEVLTKMQYDHAGRLLNITKRIDGQTEKPVVQNSYNELGQLLHKQLGQHTQTGSPLEQLDYSYNIRGWMTGINKDFANQNEQWDESRWFGMELNYDFGFTKNQFNGNISGTIWKARGSGKNRAYGFDYDNANRLLKGDFTQQDVNATGTWNTNSGIDFSMKMGDGINHNTAYDANGNIKQMQHMGLLLTTSSPIDNLLYSYLEIDGSNKLKSVVDVSTSNPQSKLGDFKTSTNHPQNSLKQSISTSSSLVQRDAITDYEYDANGNLMYDNNKDISSIEYNHLNLPATIAVINKGTITYVYDAAGNKLQKTTVDNTVNPAKTTITHYVNGFVYEQINNDPAQLQFFAHEEGRIRYSKDANNNITGYAFDYYIKDHLGNVRTMLTDEEKTDVYHASFEDANYSFESQLFSPLENLVQPNDCFQSTSENSKVQKLGKAKDDGLNGRQQVVVGAGKVLKVMAGDKVNVNVLGWFDKSIQAGNDLSNQLPIEDIITNLFANGIVNNGAKNGVFNTTNGSILTPGILNFLVDQANYTPDDAAYLNWILLDEEQFNLVQNGSGFTSLLHQHGGGCEPAVLLQANNGDGIEIKRNGYLYIYTSNTNTEYPVYFDDLHIEHIRGSLIEENTYYPFGLMMQGICSKAANTLENKKKYNTASELQSNEFSDWSGLEWYDVIARTYDHQLGRFMQIDPIPDEEEQERWSPYHYCFNNPIINNDPDGKSPVVPIGVWLNRFLRFMIWLEKLPKVNGPVPTSLKAVIDETAVKKGYIQELPSILKTEEEKKVDNSQNSVIDNENSIRKEHGGGKNAPHKNQKARESAKEKYEKARENYQQLTKKPNKTKEDKKAIDKAKKEMEREKRKMDEKGETHSRKAKH